CASFFLANVVVSRRVIHGLHVLRGGGGAIYFVPPIADANATI
ncbi:MAG: hypothetical protein QOD03_59, partial [Verrucomicrobiota bacterium]